MAWVGLLNMTACCRHALNMSMVSGAQQGTVVSMVSQLLLLMGVLSLKHHRSWAMHLRLHSIVVARRTAATKAVACCISLQVQDGGAS